MNIYSKTLLLLLLIFTTPIITNAQEVFFKDNSKRLVGLRPSHFYPMQVANTLREYIDKIPEDNLSVISAQPVNSTDRFGVNGEALGMNGIDGYIRASHGSFKEMTENKVMNMSFWVRYPDEVYNGSKEGILFSIREVTEAKLKVYCAIENKKIVLSVLRKNIGGAEILVPIIEMDIPLNMEGGNELNNYFFFCITSEKKDNGDKRTRIYISRPDGSLFSRLYYTDFFDDLSDLDMLALAGGWVGENKLPATDIDDLMFYQKYDYAIRSLTPEEVLNNFYLQSPFYEGISYEISAMNGVGTWGLESGENRGVALAEEYITLSSNITSMAPFGYNRFNAKKKPDALRTFSFSNMKMGGGFYPSFNNYIYMKYNTTGENYRYIRERTPESRYSPHVGMFNLARETDGRYLQMYTSSGKEWLVADVFPGDRNRILFGINAAMKIYRGPERQYNGVVKLINYGTGGIKYVTGVIESSVNFTRGNEDRFKKLDNRLTTMNKENVGHDNRGEREYYYTHYGNASLSYLYVKNDSNGKPLYLIKANTATGDYMLGRYEVYEVLTHNYINVLNTDGTIPDTYLWSIHKAE